MAIVENVTAVLKDIKVTKKGINIAFEDVRLKGEQLQDLASLIGEVVLIGTDIPQMNLFEDEDVNELEAPQEAGAEETTEEVTETGEQLSLLEEVETVTDEEVANFQFESEGTDETQEGPARLVLADNEDVVSLSYEEVAQELGV